ncbi:hypothetical protein K239x_19700 [Planctomycetes bacterium K23_9]|uniref:Uncharacterized protein n=1 Tax=Stieleria marina TaxID=1930275 RepID=A0A517NSA6_9BACT|nr:hypothetical protein K239x_19700 [Planctomycetes bacterium K23_9]
MYDLCETPVVRYPVAPVGFWRPPDQRFVSTADLLRWVAKRPFGIEGQSADNGFAPFRLFLSAAQQAFDRYQSDCPFGQKLYVKNDPRFGRFCQSQSKSTEETFYVIETRPANQTWIRKQYHGFHLKLTGFLPRARTHLRARKRTETR